MPTGRCFIKSWLSCPLRNDRDHQDTCACWTTVRQERSILKLNVMIVRASERQKLCAWTALFIFFSVLAFFPPCFKSLNFGVTSTSERFFFLVEHIETFAGFLIVSGFFFWSSSVGIEPRTLVLGPRRLSRLRHLVTLETRSSFRQVKQIKTFRNWLYSFLRHWSFAKLNCNWENIELLISCSQFDLDAYVSPETNRLSLVKPPFSQFRSFFKELISLVFLNLKIHWLRLKGT
jgi:hypothetical protein